MKKIGKILLFATLLILLVGVVSAAEINENTAITEPDTITSESNIEKDLQTEETTTNIQKENTTSKTLQKTTTTQVKEAVSVNDWQGLTNAVNEAKNNNQNTTITLGQGTYVNEGTLTWDSTGNVLTIDGNGQTINGNQNQVFIINSRASLVLKNITITNARSENGGAIKNYGNLTVTQSTLNNNIGTWGGVIYNEYETVTINNSTLSNNTATGSGGAIYDNGGTITINTSTLQNNKATFDGGVISNRGTLTVTQSTLNNNTAEQGGAIYNQGPLTISNSTLNNNTATKYGGAIYNVDGTTNLANNSELNYNHAYDSGGAICISDGHLSIVDSRLENNHGSEYGGAIYDRGLYNSYVNIRNSNFTENYGGNGAAIYCIPYGRNMNYNISNNIFIRNHASNHETLNLVGTRTLEGNTYISTDIALKNVHISVKDDRTNFTYIEDVVLNFDTIEVENPDNYDQNLLDNPENSLDDLKNILDNREYKTIYVNDEQNVTTNHTSYTLSNLKIGEYTVYYTFANMGYESNRVTFNIIPISNWQELKDAVNLAKSNTEYTTIILGPGTFENEERIMWDSVSNVLTIEGNGQTINGNQKEVFFISNGCSLVLKNITITNAQSAHSGGAIYNSYGTLTVFNSTLNNNQAPRMGGAIYNDRGTVTINNSTLNSNSAANGGAIYNNNGGTVTINNSTLNNNQASENGGAICSDGVFACTVIVKNSTFTENYGGNGAAIYCNNQGSLNHTFSGNTFIRNHASNHETLVFYGSRTLEDNTYIYTDISLKDLHLTVKDDQNIFIYGEDVVLNFIFDGLTNPYNYDENILDNPENIFSDLKDRTIYINNEQNTRTNHTNYTLSNLHPGEYAVYYTYLNMESNTVTFSVKSYSEITTDKLTYDFYEGIANKITLYITDNFGHKGNINISVKDGEEYTKLLSYSNIKDGNTIYVPTITEALEYHYTTLDSSYIINVTYNSSGLNVTPSSTEFILNINKQKNTTIIYNILNNTEKNVQINLTVIDTITHSPIDNAPITVTGDISRDATTGILTDNTLTPGDYSINVYYTETENYKSSDATINFTVEIDKDAKIEELEEELDELLAPKETTITLNPLTDAKYNSNVTISGTLISEGTNGLFDQTVTLTVDGSEVNVTTVGGLFGYNTTFKAVGEQTVVAAFAGTDKYKASNTALTFTVSKKESEITINDIATVTCNDNVTITGLVTSIDGTLLGNVNIYVYLNGEEQHVKTYSNGKFKATFTITTVGKQEVQVIYKGNNKYMGSNATSTFTASGTKLVMFTVKPVTYRDTYTIQGKLTDCEGNIITGAEVQLMVNGETISLMTDKNGRYTYKAQALKVGNFTVTATYDDETTATELSATKTLEVTKRETKLIVDEITDTQVGSEATITGKLTDNNGTSYKNCYIVVKINGEQETIKTDNKGIFTYTYIPTRAGTQNVTITYKGNSNYLGDKVTTSFKAKD